MAVKVLIRFPHGLGDVVQLGVVLAHLRKYRPDWLIDVRCGRGKHTALIGLCNKVFHDQEPEPSGPYDRVSELGWYENYNAYTDRPNSKVTNCLVECFGIDYDKALGRYEIKPDGQSRHTAATYLESIGCVHKEGKFNTVLIHYAGNTSTDKKNLAHWQARSVIDFVLRAGRVPVVLDWDRRSPLPDGKSVHCPAVGPEDIWGGFGSGDAAVIAALVRQSEAFIGIDSGPGKCASASDTPTLICWKALHPIQFHDPAPNTTHLVPHDWRKVPPCQNHGVAAYFEDHYLFQTYYGDRGLVRKVIEWLSGVLRVDATDVNSVVPFVLPNGIGDVTWALHKIRSIAGDRPVEIILAGEPTKEIDHRSVHYLKRFPWIKSSSVLDVPHLLGRDSDANDVQGRYRYVPDGQRDGFHYLMPNAVLERGQRLEEWFPDVPIDWNVMDTFDWSGTERGAWLGESLDPFVAFYLGPESGNVDEGHNRGFLWEPKHWVQLGKALSHDGMKIVVVGADYDRSYWTRYVRDGVKEQGMEWIDCLGKFEIGETFALLKHAKCLISYQCGLGIVLHYLGGRVAMWWRPYGNSCHPDRLVSFDERMATAWTNPRYQDNYIPLIYKRETVGDLLAEIDKRGWLK